MNPKSIVEINNIEIDQVVGGFYNNKLLEGAVASATIKVVTYYFENWLPVGERGTFSGEVWNGAIKGISCFLSIVSIGVVGSYVVEAVQKNPIVDQIY